MNKSEKTMIVRIISIILFLASCWPSKAENRIDSLKSDTEVLDFVGQFFPDFNPLEGFERYYRKARKRARIFKVKNWVVTDIDNNGESDLIVFRAFSLPEVVVILSFKGRFKKATAGYRCMNLEIYPLLTHTNGRNIILLYKQDSADFDTKRKKLILKKLNCDTIIVKDTLLLNYLPEPKTYDIENIEISNDGLCEGDCPRINIKINPKTLESECSEDFWDCSLKSRKGKLSQYHISKILSLLSYSNFSDLNDDYNVECTDQTTTTLTITYDNGRTKQIMDYGSSGNFTLSEIYRIALKSNWIE